MYGMLLSTEMQSPIKMMSIRSVESPYLLLKAKG